MDETFEKMKEALSFAALQNCKAIQQIGGLNQKQRGELAFCFAAAVLGGVTPIACANLPDLAKQAPKMQMLSVLNVLQEDILDQLEKSKGLMN